MKKNAKGIIGVLGSSLLKFVFSMGLIAFLVMGTAFDGSVVFAKDKKDKDLIVKTKDGKVKGLEWDEDTWAWLSIPYAKPPVGDLRWKAPQEPDKWHGVKDTTEFCEECSQSGAGSEDCLYLNIWRPQSQEKKLPVYFWIHGGSNVTGNAETYIGASIANRSNMVVVVIQYRLGPFGWLAHPALRTGDPLDDSGNFGTLDAILALEWVQDNIKKFGGDPDNITIAGESAGAHDVMTLVISELATGLFHKAISQSGGMLTQSVANGEAAANAMIDNLLETDGLAQVPDGDVDGDVDDDDVEIYLRGKTNLDILAAQEGSRSAFEDGYVVPGDFYSTIASGDYNKVPIILGSNEDEMKFFLNYSPIPTSGVFNWTHIFLVFLPFYTLDDILPSDVDKALYQACGDFGSLNWRYTFVDALARPLREQQKKVYAYLFKWDGEEGSDYDFLLGASHATEIPFFFGGTSDIYGGLAFYPGNDTPGRQALSEAMMKYVAQFARTGKPKVHGLPKWKEWSNKEGKEKAIVFDATYDEADIYMIDQEITEDTVNATFWELYDSLPVVIQDTLWYFNWY